MNKQTEDIIEILQNDFNARKIKNSSYSLRAYANFLDIDSSQLSKILKGKRKASESLLESLRSKLDLPLATLEDAIETAATDSVLNKFRMRKAAPKHTDKDISDVDFMIDWREYALLQIMSFKDYKQDNEWICSTLGITQEKLLQLVDNLKSNNMLIEDDKGNWLDNKGGSFSSTETTKDDSRSKKAFKTAALNRAKDALKAIEKERMYHHIMMIPTSQEKIKEAKLIIKESNRKISDFLQDTDKKDCLYQLNTSLFPLTK